MLILPAILIGQFFLALGIYLLIEKLIKKKPWHYRIPILLFFILVLPYFVFHFGIWLECPRPRIEPKCGFGSDILSSLISIDFIIISIAVLIRKIFFK